jgi:hypothetical protein
MLIKASISIPEAQEILAEHMSKHFGFEISPRLVEFTFSEKDGIKIEALWDDEITGSNKTG